METLRYIRYRLQHSGVNATMFLVTALLVLAIPVTLFGVKQVQTYKANAAFEKTVIAFSPSSQRMPPDSNFKILLNVGPNAVKEVKIHFTFNATKVRVVDEINVSDKLTNVGVLTSKEEANRTGSITLSAQVSPDQTLTGLVELASFNLKAVTAQEDLPSTLTFIDSQTEIKDIDGNVLPFESRSAVLTLNSKL